MSTYAIDLKYVSYVGQHVDQFKWKGGDTANFRCPICGDSQKDKLKARGYMLPVNNGFVYKCHNCGISYALKTFLQVAFPALYEQYNMEVFESKFTQTEQALPDIGQPEPEPEVIVSDIKHSQRVTELRSDHDAVQYITQRAIPEAKWDRLHFTDNFRQAVLETSRNSRYKRLPQDRRILIPLRKKNGQVFGLQGRRIDAGKDPKYITIKFDQDHPKIFGLDTVDTTKPVIVVEGPLDSLFLPNCVAICGGDVNYSIKQLGAPTVYAALDNERRNPDTIARMGSALKLGCHVVFWQYTPEVNDINDMVFKYGRRDVINHIVNHSAAGMAGEAELGIWKRTPGRKTLLTKQRST